MIHRLLLITPVIALKLVAIAVPLYCTLYLFVIGDLEHLGRYSTIVALLAPIAMLSAFRYIEHISTSDNKAKALFEAILSSLTIFLPFTIIGFFLLLDEYSAHFSYWPWLLLAYKALELSNDILIAQLASSNEIRRAAIICVSKLTLVIAFSLILALLELDPLLALSASLLVGYGIGFIIFDAFALAELRASANIDLGSLVRYMRDNVRFGVLNLLISLNSVMPRYFYIWAGSLTELGLFTLLYQLTATIVNIIQYAFSIYAQALSQIARVHHRVLSTLLYILISLFVVVFFTQSATIIPSPFPTPYIFVPIMTAAMLFRGLYITVRVVEKSYILNRIQLIAILSSTVLTFSLFLPSGDIVSVAPYFYVSLSSLIAAILASRRSRG